MYDGRGGKRGYVFFTTIKPDKGHPVYLSAYGYLVSALLQKYVEDQKADNEELFAEWDKSVQKASSQAGSTTSLEVEDGCLYISSFQDGIGMPPEDETESKKRSEMNDDK